MQSPSQPWRRLAMFGLLAASLVGASTAFAEEAVPSSPADKKPPSATPPEVAPAPKLTPEEEQEQKLQEERKAAVYGENVEERSRRAFNVYPVGSFKYEWQRDWNSATSTFHHFELAMGLHIPLSTSDRILFFRYHGIRLQGSGLFDIGETHGRSARRKGLLFRADYVLDTGVPDLFGRESPRGLREDFPEGRGTLALFSCGFEAGFVQNKTVGFSNEETATRLEQMPGLDSSSLSLLAGTPSKTMTPRWATISRHRSVCSSRGFSLV